MSEQLPQQTEATTAPVALTISSHDENLEAMTPKQFIGSRYIHNQVAKALPGIFTPERFMRVTLTAFNKNPRLLECSKASIASVIFQSAQWGLEPDGRHAHIIPYKGEATLQIDYKGLVALVRRSGEVASLHADVVCASDAFDYNLGEILEHRIDFKQPRGPVFAVYATATLKDGSKQSVVMTKDEVDAIAARSNSVKAAKTYGKTTPWDTDWSEMAKKTAFRRLTKWLPLSFEAADAVDHDTRREFGAGAIDVTPQITSQPAQDKPLAAKLLAAPAKKPKAQPRKPDPEPQQENTDADDGL
jgi:recombination protein RecT